MLMTSFPDCCYGCVPPKRNDTCHCTCQEYKDAKKKYEADLEEERKNYQGIVDAFMVSNRGRAVARKPTLDRMNCKWRK